MLFIFIVLSGIFNCVNLVKWWVYLCNVWWILWILVIWELIWKCINCIKWSLLCDLSSLIVDNICFVVKLNLFFLLLVFCYLFLLIEFKWIWILIDGLMFKLLILVSKVVSLESFLIIMWILWFIFWLI